MNNVNQAIMEQASKLSAIEKVELIQALLASVDKPDPAIDSLWEKESESRLAAYKCGDIHSLSLNQVLEKHR